MDHLGLPTYARGHDPHLPILESALRAASPLRLRGAALSCRHVAVCRGAGVSGAAHGARRAGGKHGHRHPAHVQYRGRSGSARENGAYDGCGVAHYGRRAGGGALVWRRGYGACRMAHGVSMPCARDRAFAGYRERVRASGHARRCGRPLRPCGLCAAGRKLLCSHLRNQCCFI